MVIKKTVIYDTVERCDTMCHAIVLYTKLDGQCYKLAMVVGPTTLSVLRWSPCLCK